MRRFLLALILVLVAAPAADAALATKAAKKKVPLLRIDEGATALEIDPAFASALGTAGLTATAISGAQSTDGGVFAFELVAGRLAGNKPAAGYLRHHGGLRLSRADGTHVDLNNLRINDGKVAAITAQIGAGERITLAGLDVANAEIGLTRKRFVVSDAGVILSDEAAAALNSAFGTTAFAGQTRVATAAIVAKIRIKLKDLKK